jgi:histidinol phosphatase-like PHP family hydrolase
MEFPSQCFSGYARNGIDQHTSAHREDYALNETNSNAHVESSTRQVCEASLNQFDNASLQDISKILSLIDPAALFRFKATCKQAKSVIDQRTECLAKGRRFVLEHASHPEWKNDREVVLAAVEQNGLALEFASDALKNDPLVVLAAVEQNGRALEFASDALKNNRRIVLAAVELNFWAFQFASDALTNDREVVLAAVKQDGWALAFASDALKNDRDVVLAAVEQNGWTIQFAGDDLKNDREVVRSGSVYLNRWTP